MPFRSEAQRRWMYANHPQMAAEWEAHTPKGAKLPKKKRKKKAAHPWQVKAMGRFDPSKHPRDHGKFSHSPGASGPTPKPPGEMRHNPELDAMFDEREAERAGKPPTTAAPPAPAAPAASKPNLAKPTADRAKNPPHEAGVDIFSLPPGTQNLREFPRRPSATVIGGHVPRAPGQNTRPAAPHEASQRAALHAARSVKPGDHASHAAAVQALDAHEKQGLAELRRRAQTAGPRAGNMYRKAAQQFRAKLSAARAKIDQLAGKGPPPVPRKPGQGPPPLADRGKVRPWVPLGESGGQKPRRPFKETRPEEASVNSHVAKLREIQANASKRGNRLNHAYKLQDRYLAQLHPDERRAVLEAMHPGVSPRRRKAALHPWLTKAKGSSESGGRWITIGGKKDSKGKRRGGSPVFIKDGKIVKGHPSLTGKKIGALNEGADDTPKPESKKEARGRNQAEHNQSRGYEAAVWRKKARKAGHDPKHLEELAGQIKAHHDAFAAERKHVVKFAREHSMNNYETDLRQASLGAARGGDWTKIRGFDQTAENTQEAFPHHFREDSGERGGVEDQLFDMLTAGDPKPMSHAEAYETAFNQLGEAAPKAKRERKPKAADDSFDFGFNEKAFSPPSESDQEKAYRLAMEAGILEEIVIKDTPVQSITSVDYDPASSYGKPEDGGLGDKLDSLIEAIRNQPAPTIINNIPPVPMDAITVQAVLPPIDLPDVNVHVPAESIKVELPAPQPRTIKVTGRNFQGQITEATVEGGE